MIAAVRCRVYADGDCLSFETEAAPIALVNDGEFGRERSRHGIEDYLEIEYLCMDNH